MFWFWHFWTLIPDVYKCKSWLWRRCNRNVAWSLGTVMNRLYCTASQSELEQGETASSGELQLPALHGLQSAASQCFPGGMSQTNSWQQSCYCRASCRLESFDRSFKTWTTSLEAWHAFSKKRIFKILTVLWPCSLLEISSWVDKNNESRIF